MIVSIASVLVHVYICATSYMYFCSTATQNKLVVDITAHECYNVCAAAILWGVGGVVWDILELPHNLATSKGLHVYNVYHKSMVV